MSEELEKQGEQKVPDVTVVHKELNEYLKPQGKQKPVECMYSKDNYTDEDRKVLCDGCQEECKFKPVEWSEEDEERQEETIELLETLIDHPKFRNYATTRCVDWLKSLRPQKQWKPSDEQMDALHYVTNFDYGGHKATLVSLYEQLKKLKG